VIYEFPWCLHKTDETEWDITRMLDPVRVLLQDCGGVRTSTSVGECRSGNPIKEGRP